MQLFYLKIINRVRIRNLFSVFLQSIAFVFKRCFLSLSFRLSKSKEDKDELQATLSSLKKEGCKINRTLKVNKQNKRALAFAIRNQGLIYDNLSPCLIKAVSVELLSLLTTSLFAR